MPPHQRSGQHHHRAGPLRQSNKKHKSSTASKRSQGRKIGAGRVGSTGSNVSSLSSASSRPKRTGLKHHPGRHGRNERMHMAKQRRDAARQRRVLSRRLKRRSMEPIPKLIGIVALSAENMYDAKMLEESLRSHITKEALDSNGGVDGRGGSNFPLVDVAVCRFDAHKCSIAMLLNSTAFHRQLMTNGDHCDDEDAVITAALDLCRVCDCIMFVTDGSPYISAASMKGSQNDLDSVVVSGRGQRILSACKAQGLPSTLMCVVFNSTIDIVNKKSMKKRAGLKKYCHRFATSEFGDGARIIDVDLTFLGGNDGAMKRMEKDEGDMAEDYGESDKDCGEEMEEDESACVLSDLHSSFTIAESRQSSALVRTLCTMKMSPCRWTSQRPHLVGLGGHTYDKSTRELRITGLTRGTGPFDVHKLVHVPYIGTFHVNRVEAAGDATSGGRKGTAAEKYDTENDVDMEGAGSSVLLVQSDSYKRESLQRFAIPDALEGEQNLVGFEDDNEDRGSRTGTSEGEGAGTGEARPAGWSDYQAAWLDAVPDDDDLIDHGELAEELNAKSSTAAGSMQADDDDLAVVNDEERHQLIEQRRKERKEDLDFPDEVEVKPTDKASERFARYRSLKSFRKSYWDPKENLPESYATLYHFSSFRATQRDVLEEQKEIADTANRASLEYGWTAGGNDGRIMKTRKPAEDVDMKDDEEEGEDVLKGCVASGAYVTLVIENVPLSDYSRSKLEATKAGEGAFSWILCAVNLLRHENKISVLHVAVSRTSACDDVNSDLSTSPPVKSKDVLTFRCGWRSWKGRPIFSQNNLNSDKHKFERFLPTSSGTFVAASVLGPVTYGPCPALVFRESEEASMLSNASTERQLVAVGSVMGADADRIMVKRVTLTGYPTRVHKRNATVKYMFYNPDDVKWFKPAGLTTKHGLRGHIMESVGEHGSMKCLFNQPIKQHDTVCLPLYKRVYPKYCDVHDCYSRTNDEHNNIDDGGENSVVAASSGMSSNKRKLVIL